MQKWMTWQDLHSQEKTQELIPLLWDRPGSPANVVGLHLEPSQPDPVSSVPCVPGMF